MHHSTSGRQRSQKIFDISAKVAKQFCKGHDEEDCDYIHYGSDNHSKHSTETLRCFHCNKIGHIKANCLERKGKEKSITKSVLQEKVMIGACLVIYVTDYTDYDIVFPKMWKLMLSNKMFEI